MNWSLVELDTRIVKALMDLAQIQRAMVAKLDSIADDISDIRDMLVIGEL